MFVNGFEFFLGGIVAKWFESILIIGLVLAFFGCWWLYIILSDKYCDWKQEKNNSKQPISRR